MRIIFRDLTDDPDAKVPHPHHGYVKDGKQYGGLVHPYTFWFKEYLGKAQVLGTDNEEGRIYLRAMAQINDETLTMWRDLLAPRHEEVEGTRAREERQERCQGTGQCKLASRSTRTHKSNRLNRYGPRNSFR